MGKFKLFLPTAMTNEATNPSFETDTGGWVNAGTNLMTRESDNPFYGSWSLKTTYKDNALLAGHNVTLSNNKTWYLTGWINVSSWDGGAIKLYGDGFTNGNTTLITTFTGAADELGIWFQLRSTMTTVTDPAGTVKIGITGSPPSVDTVIYIDALQIVEGSTEYSYVDGDQPGGVWNGIAHESTSRRLVTSRAGGQILDVEDDLSMWVEKMSGIGFAPIRHLSRQRAHIDGDEFERTLAKPAIFRLTSRVKGDSLSNLHSKRNAIVDLIKPDDESGLQPFIMEYRGALPWKRIAARYDTGLPLSKGSGFSELVAIQCIAHDPFWKREGWDGDALDEQDTKTFRYMGARVDGVWSLIPKSAATTPGTVNAVLVGPDRKLYVAGNFQGWDNTTGHDYISKYNFEDDDWEFVGSSGDVNAPVQCMTVAPDGTIWMGGLFTNVAGNGNSDYIVKYDPSTNGFSPVGTHGSATVTAVNAIGFAADGTPHVAGDFTTFESSGDDHIVKWNGSAWVPVGAPTAAAKSLAFHPNGNLYVGGAFLNQAGVGAADYLAIHDGTSWAGPASPIGTSGDSINKILIDSLTGTVYVFGDITQMNGSDTVGKSARFVSSLWESMPGWDISVTSTLLNDAVFLPDGRILAGGDSGISGSGFFANTGVAGIWNGSSWRAVDFDPNFNTGLTGATITAVGVDGTNGNYFLGLDDSTDAEVSGDVTIANNGTVRSWPIIKIWLEPGTGGAGEIHRIRRIANETTGVELFFDYAINEGERITFDFRPGQRSVVSSFAGDIWPFLPGSNVTDFYLRTGNNLITFHLIKAGGTGTFETTIGWEEQYWGVD